MAVSIMEDDGETKEWVESCGVQYRYVPADITADGECKRVVEECVKTWGSVDILVNCAGICINIEDVTQVYQKRVGYKMVSVNLTAAFEMIHESCKYMIKQNSGIKSSTLHPFLPFWAVSGHRHTLATKHGIVGLTKSMCDELAQFNIQVNAIAPGYFATKLTEKKQEAMPKETVKSSLISRQTAGVILRTLWGPAYSLPATLPTMSTDIRSR